MPPDVTRVRMTRSALLVVAFLALCMSPVALARPWLAVVFLLPITLAAWVLRAGVDVDSEGLTVRAVLGVRRVGWDDVAGLALTRRGEVRLALRNGRTVRLPVVRARHLATLAAAS
ncbi:MAG TPA: PH domain-containing protein, partial [Mycobacteriales bacterium]